MIFSDGIRPGTDLDEPTSSSPRAEKAEKPPKINMPQLNDKNNSFITEGLYNLPPILSQDGDYKFVDNNLTLLQRLRQEELKFAINKNFYVTVKIVTRKSPKLMKLLASLILLSFSFLLHEQNGDQLCDIGTSGCSAR